MVTLTVKDKIFPDVEAIVFDKDGTLANTESYLIQLGQKRSRLVDAQVPGVQEPIQMAYGLENGQLNPEGMMAIASRKECEIATAGFVAETGKPWIEALNLCQSAFAEAADYLDPKCEHTPLLDGTVDLLQRLSVHPVKIGVLSSDITANVNAFVDHHGLREYVDLGQGVEGMLAKPDPQVLLNFCQKLQVDPRKTVMIGDSAADIQMAIAAQAGGNIGVTWGWQKSIRLPKADVEASSPDQIQIET